jgi:hypothetical protein
MTPGDLRRIKDGARVSAVLSLQHDDCLAYWSIDYSRLYSEGRRLALAMERCPIRDFDTRDMRRHLPAATASLARLQAAGHRTYVHCTAGLGRAPLVVLGYLTLVEGIAPDQAIQLILEGRPGAVPSWEAYHGARSDLVARFRREIEHRAHQLSEQGPTSDMAGDWHQAEFEVLRTALHTGVESCHNPHPESSNQ